MILKMARGHLDFVYNDEEYRITGETLLHGASEIEFFAYANTLTLKGGGEEKLEENKLNLLFEDLRSEFRLADRVLTVEG